MAQRYFTQYDVKLFLTTTRLIAKKEVFVGLSYDQMIFACEKGEVI